MWGVCAMAADSGRSRQGSRKAAARRGGSDKDKERHRKDKERQGKVRERQGKVKERQCLTAVNLCRVDHAVVLAEQAPRCG